MYVDETTDLVELKHQAETKACFLRRPNV